MSAHPRKMLKEIEHFLEAHGIAVVSEERTKRHRRVRVTDGVKSATITVSISPSDHRVYHQIVKSARNALREAP